LFKASGYRVVLADCQRFPLSRFTRLKDRYVQLPRPIGAMKAYVEALAQLIAEEKPSLVMPTCEEVFYLAAARDLHGLDIPLFAPAFELLARVHNKHSFADMIIDLPVGRPDTVLINSARDVEPLLSRSQSLIFKPVWSRFGDRVLRRPSPAALRTVDWQNGGPWIAQTYLPGEELSVYAMAVNGRLVAHQAYRGLYRASGGAAIAFAPVDRADISGFLKAFVAGTGWTGQISFDFRLDAQGILHAIECNPRATSGLHFFGPEDGLIDAIVGSCEAQASQHQPMTMRLALATYGLSDAWRSHRLKEWLGCFMETTEITNWPGDRSFNGPQFLALGEIICLALKFRCGLKAAATADTEWNGGPML
jgi:hypothetical protein